MVREHFPRTYESWYRINYRWVRMGTVPIKLIILQRLLAPGWHVGELGDGLGAGMDVKFLVNVPDVSVDGGDAETQGFGDFLIEVSLRQQFEHFAFARRKSLRFDFFWEFVKRLDHFAGD